MSKYANEMPAWAKAKGIVIFKGARHVAAIYCAYPRDGMGRLRVTCFQACEAAEKTAKTLAKMGRDGDGYVQHGSAGGCGYDKLTAALSGMVIDGHKLTDHCGENKKPPKGAKVWPRNAKAPRGYAFANYDSKANGYGSCYRQPGLRYLQDLGYTVVTLG